MPIYGRGARDTTFTRQDTTGSSASAINLMGQAVGWVRTEDGMNHAALWNGRRFVNLNGTAIRSQANGIKVWGQVVGEASFTDENEPTAVLWGVGGRKPIDLNVYLPPEAAQAGWRMRSAMGINDFGVIVGKADKPPRTQRGRSFRLTPIWHK